jgi:beta-mannosidase
MADWHWATQLNQARAVRLGVEHFRSWSPRCAGSVVWQLNDCWPVTSWALVDGDGRRKPAWYALRRGYADRLLTVQPRDGGLAVVAVNDTGTAWSGTLAVTRRHVDGRVLADWPLVLDVPARQAVTLPLPGEVATAGEPAAELLAVSGGGTRALWFFVPDRELKLPPADADRAAAAVDGGYRVTVTARTLLRDVAVLADRVAPDAEVDDMLVTLLPGESVAFAVRTAARLDPDALLGPAVLRTANDLLG